ncbi:MAG TPA: class I SAM-dependent methyltransferase [Geminicoccaceae bacterium]|nr:class I SAM-dependent methyltransferase [Geminicoccus sp.]HMU50293.1 class I SAM-dependent methyltransferase [Geminicoccaceae bacterium]
MASDWMARSYDRYFETGFYEHRYPSPNPMTLRTAVGQIREAGPRVIDFGCGSGRYARALLESTEARIIGYDVSHVALDRLSRHCAAFIPGGRLVPVGENLDRLADAVRAWGGADLAMLLFGVLGHVQGRQGRRDVLEALRGMLRRGGRLVVSVPNARQRFHRERRETEGLRDRSLEPGDIVYTRQHGGEAITLYYHLYEPGELEGELSSCGFRLLDVHAESVLPERAVVTNRLSATVDAALAAVLPLRLAYGFLAVAEAE